MRELDQLQNDLQVHKEFGDGIEEVVRNEKDSKLSVEQFLTLKGKFEAFVSYL